MEVDMAKPLEGIRVLDLTRVLAGPFCTMLLSDLGAEIVKVEAPVVGDDSRHFGPFRNGKSLYFLNVNRGKESICIDLKNPAGKKLLVDLAKECDVVVENFRPGTMEKLGLGWDVLREANPRLVYGAVSGFGHSGPDSLKPAYDILVQARGGVMSITGWPDSPPTRVGMSMGDITAAIFAAVGIVAALYQRKDTGRGQKVDVAMLDCQLAILENALVRYQVDGKVPAPLGTRHPTISPFQTFKASDAWFAVAVGNDALWKAFCPAIGRSDLFEDARFRTNADRTHNLPFLAPELEAVFAARTADEWVRVLEDAGVPAAPVADIAKVMKDRQLAARNMFVEAPDGSGGTVIIPGNPVKMETIPEDPTRPAAPELGEHTEEILGRLLRLGADELGRLRAEGALP
ncbi:MAG: CoA transferase [Spirochaetales bacterium]|nr:CoA transferase [Spirochaetales bacterium]